MKGNHRHQAYPLDKKNVALMLRLEIMPGRQQLVGIFRYMKLHARAWNIVLAPSAEAVTAAKARFDGIICAENDNAQRAHELLSPATSLVAIDVGSGVFAAQRARTTFINVDDDAIGRMAAEHLLGQGRARCAAFVGAPGEPAWSKARQTAFRRTVRNANMPFHAFTDGDAATPPLVDWLRTLPLPAALMAANDQRAVQVIESCRAAKLHVPEQISLVSVDNDGLYCDCMEPTLSSVDPDYEREGFLAAQELDRLMSATRTPRTRRMLIPPTKVVARESTSSIRPASSLVERALVFIRENACRGITVDDVVQSLGVSRRLLYLRFAQFQGESIGVCIHRHQLARMQQLLRETDMSITKVTAACGFSEDKYPKRLFKRTFGVSMSSFRHASSQRWVCQAPRSR